jgi:hypothetical protein
MKNELIIRELCSRIDENLHSIMEKSSDYEFMLAEQSHKDIHFLSAILLQNLTPEQIEEERKEMDLALVEFQKELEQQPQALEQLDNYIKEIGKNK